MEVTDPAVIGKMRKMRKTTEAKHCKKCKKIFPKKSNTNLCNFCYRYEYNKKLRKERKERKMCIACGKKIEPKIVYPVRCGICATKSKKFQKRWEERSQSGEKKK